jgi:hypothetical protein
MEEEILEIKHLRQLPWFFMTLDEDIFEFLGQENYCPNEKHNVVIECYFTYYKKVDILRRRYYEIRKRNIHCSTK